MSDIGTKYLNELPAIVSDARATFHGLKEAEIMIETNEMKAVRAIVFKTSGNMT